MYFEVVDKIVEKVMNKRKVFWSISEYILK